jgi:hypothetical protein
VREAQALREEPIEITIYDRLQAFAEAGRSRITEQLSADDRSVRRA